jgi:hypothetical protein
MVSISVMEKAGSWLHAEEYQVHVHKCDSHCRTTDKMEVHASVQENNSKWHLTYSTFRQL